MTTENESEVAADRGPPGATAELTARRRRIARSLLGGLVALGGIAYVPSVWAAAAIGAWAVVVMDTVLYGLVIAVFARRSVSDGVRAATVVGVAGVLGATLSVGFGPNGAGALWLCAVPVLSALLFDRRATLWSLGLVTAVLALVTALRAAGILAWDVTPGGTLLWIVISGNVLLLAGALGLGVTALISGLAEAAQRTEEYGAALAREQADLLEANDRLERAIGEREAAETRLRQGEKLTSIGTLASGIAHDMNNLLVPILAGTELLRADERDPERAELLDRTLGAARAARDLVDRILAFSRPGGDARAPIDATECFRDGVRLLHAALPARVSLSFRADPEAGRVVLSNAEAQQLVLNLGTNAAHAMPDGGRMIVEVDTIPAGRQPPDVPTPDSCRFVRLSVVDFGVGMDRETMARMFDPFFTRRDRGEGGAGHGIGLATVYSIVSSAGGYIVVHSKVGEGTTMEVFLPQAEVEEEAEPRPGVGTAGDGTAAGDEGSSGAMASAAAAGERILVVDDDEDVRVMARRVLETAGYRVSVAASAEAALRVTAAEPPFDLVITDYNMPRMDGLALARSLRSSRPDLPLVVMSGLIDDRLREAAAAVEVDGVVGKPFGAVELTRTVARALEERRVGNGSS